jgi:hypothetical protein
MRRRTSLSLTVILGLVGTLGMTPHLVVAQEPEQTRVDEQSRFSDGISVELDPTERDIATANQQVRAVPLVFEAQSYVPERRTPRNETMVVKILQGRFVFRVQSPDVIVDPQGNEIQLMTADPPIPLGESPADSLGGRSPDPNPESRFSEGGPMPLSGCSNTDPSLCALNPALFANGDTFVVLERGYTVILPPMSTCFFCNTTPVAEGDQTARALFWVSGEGYKEWTGEELVLSTEPDQTLAQRQGLHEIRGWMLDPGSPCH